LSSAERATIELFDNVSHSVVCITSIARGRDFFSLKPLEIPQGAGSGFIWDDQGHVVTNYHVIRNGQTFEVTLSDQSVWRAAVVGADPDHDLAVLRIPTPPGKLRPIPLGTSADLQVGQTVFAIGNPFGLDQTLTTGVVSALGRTFTAMTGREIEGVIQTDAAINPGNSGGPLLDSASRLIGVNTRIYTTSGSSAGIGFAVPVDTVNRVVPQLIAHGRVIRPHLGIRMVDDSVARRLRVEGVIVLTVVQGSGADLAGLQGIQQTPGGDIVLGDVIKRIDDRVIADSEDLLDELEEHKVGDVVEVAVERGEELRVFKVRLQAPRR
jgi:S1-C subfamily serine protease